MNLPRHRPRSISRRSRDPPFRVHCFPGWHSTAGGNGIGYDRAACVCVLARGGRSFELAEHAPSQVAIGNTSWRRASLTLCRRLPGLDPRAQSFQATWVWSPVYNRKPCATAWRPSVCPVRVVFEHSEAVDTHSAAPENVFQIQIPHNKDEKLERQRTDNITRHDALESKSETEVALQKQGGMDGSVLRRC